MAYGEGSFGEVGFGDGVADAANISAVMAGSWGTLDGIAFPNAIYAVVAGAWGSFTGAVIADLIHPAVPFKNWGQWNATTVAIATGPVQATAQGSWDRLYGDAAANSSVHTVTAAGVWSRVIGQALLERVEPIAAWELIAGFSTIRSSVVADLADA